MFTAPDINKFNKVLAMDTLHTNFALPLVNKASSNTPIEDSSSLSSAETHYQNILSKEGAPISTKDTEEEITSLQDLIESAKPNDYVRPTAKQWIEDWRASQSNMDKQKANLLRYGPSSAEIQYQKIVLQEAEIARKPAAIEISLIERDVSNEEENFIASSILEDDISLAELQYQRLVEEDYGTSSGIALTPTKKGKRLGRSAKGFGRKKVA